MKSLKLKAAAFFKFIRRERLYFLLIVLSLAVIVFHDQSYSTLPEPESSLAVEQLKQASEEWETSLQNPGGWIKIFETHPYAAMLFIFFMSLFSMLFFSGVVLLVLIKMIPRTRQWFQGIIFQARPYLCEPAAFFRVAILIFTAMVVSGACIGTFWENTAESENFIGLFYTLIIDFLVCFSIYAVLKTEGIGWKIFLWPPQGQWWKEIQRGGAAYVSVFPIFVMSLLFVIAVSNLLHYEPPLHPLVKIFVEEEKRSQLVFQFAVMLAAVAAPLMEEIFFRGFCYPAFRGWWGTRAAAGISAAFFAAIHGSGFAFLPIFILGLALAWLYEKRGNLVSCWTFHILHNVLFTGYFFTIKTFLGTSR